MALNPKNVRRATPEEIASMTLREDGWEWPEELFDGAWYRLTSPRQDLVLQMVNSYKRHAQTHHNRKATTRRQDGFVYARTLTDVKISEDKE
jgi:hypothetical protein